MRIVHVLDYCQAKLGYQDFFLARAQIEDGHEVTVVTSDRFRPFPDYEQSVGGVLGTRIRQPGRYNEEGIDVLRLPVRFEGAYRCWVNGFERELLALEPHLVIVHGVAGFFAPRVAILKARLSEGQRFRLVLDDHMVPEVRQRVSRRLFYWAFRSLFRGTLLRQADALVAVSGPTAVFMRENYRFPKDRVELVPLGADLRRFKPDPAARRAVRRAMGLHEGTVLVVHAGKLVPEKGTEPVNDNGTLYGIN